MTILRKLKLCWMLITRINLSEADALMVIKKDGRIIRQYHADLTLEHQRKSLDFFQWAMGNRQVLCMYLVWKHNGCSNN